MEIPYTTAPREDTGLYNAKLGIWLFLASEVMLFGALFSSYILLRVSADWWPEPQSMLNIPIGTFNTIVLITSSVTVVLGWAALKMNRFDRFRIYQLITILCALVFLVVKSFEYADKWKHYEVWMEDGTQMTGHIEGDPFFLTHVKLRTEGIESIQFTPDAAHGEDHAEITADDHAAADDGHHEAMEIQTSDIKRLSAFVPAHSTYFAIYFMITGLHGLHVLGGAAVMFYLLVWGHKMWKKDPERHTNRVEVSGLFWHFVDLVWIFLFPILYLM